MNEKQPDRLLWWVGGAFAVLIGAWTTFFVIASNNRVQEVPLATRPAPSAPAK